MKTLRLFLFAMVFPAGVWAQSDSTLFEMSLLELSNIEVALPTKGNHSIAKTPAVVTVISEEQIQASNPRNLSELLIMVPGFSLTTAGTPYVSVNSRGNFSTYGKILILVNGVELNENLYGVAMLNNLIDPKLIKKVEIQRGTGSILHGNFAIHAVINIITHDESATSNKINISNGVNANALPTQSSISGALNFKTNKGRWGVNAFIGYEGVSNQNDYIPIFQPDTTLDFTNSIFNQNIFLSGYYKSEAIELNLIGLQQVFEYNSIPLSPGKNVYQHSQKIALNSKYTVQLEKHTQWTNEIELAYGNPYFARSEEVAELVLNSNAGVAILKSYLQMNFNFTKFTLGYETRYDEGLYDDQYLGLYGVANTTTSALIGELNFEYEKFFFFAGIRGVTHTNFSFEPSPRIALGYSHEKFFVKGLYNRGYRPPAIGEIITNNNLNPEYSDNFEIEIGLQWTKWANTKINIFDSKNYNNIVFGVDEDFNNLYLNNSRTGNFGIEGETQILINKKLKIIINGSGSIINYNTVEAFKTEEKQNSLGLPRGTAFLLTNYKFSKRTNAGIKGNFISEIYSHQAPFGNAPTAEPASYDFDLIFNSKSKNEKIGYSITLRNILNTPAYYHNANLNILSPIRKMGTELSLSFNYKF